MSDAEHDEPRPGDEVPASDPAGAEPPDLDAQTTEVVAQRSPEPAAPSGPEPTRPGMAWYVLPAASIRFSTPIRGHFASLGE